MEKNLEKKNEIDYLPPQTQYTCLNIFFSCVGGWFLFVAFKTLLCYIFVAVSFLLVYFDFFGIVVLFFLLLF